MKRNAQKFFVLCFLLFLIGVPLLSFLMPKEDSSFYENRTLAARPELTAESVLSGDFFNEWETWFTDHVAARSYLVKLQTLLKLKVLRQSVVNDIVTDADVLLGYHGYATWDTGYLADSAEELAGNLTDWADAAAQAGGQLYYVGLPEQFAYFEEQYPAYMERRSWLYADTEAAMSTALDAAGIPYLSLYDAYREAGNPSEFYFAGDHHYTVHGALFAAQKTLEVINERQQLDLYVPQEEDLTFTTLPNPFLGSRSRKLFALDNAGDRLTVAEYTEPIPFTRADNGALVVPELLMLPENESETVTYNAFMWGDIGESVIDTHRDHLPSVLLIGESYTNAMETLLYASFDEMRSIDPRHYEGSIAAYIADFAPEVVIVLRDNTAYFSALTGG